MIKRFYRMKIRTKMFLFALLVSTLPVILLGSYLVKKTYADLEQQLLEQQKLRVNSIAQQLSGKINEVFVSLELLETVIDVEQQGVSVYDLLRRISALNEIVLVDLEGNVQQVYSRFGVNRWLEGGNWFSGAMDARLRSGQRAWGDLEQNEYMQPSIKLLVPIRDEKLGEVVGGLGAELQLQKPLGELSRQKLHQGETIYLLDNRGKIIFQGLPVTPQGDVLSTSAIIPEFGWQVVIEQSKSEAFAPMRMLLFRTVFILALVVFLIGLISTQISLSFIQPLEALQQAMSRVKEGHWPKKVPINRGDELGQLANAFYDMTRELEIKSRELIQANKLSALGQVASNFAHEVNNPLATIEAYLEDLEDRLQAEGEDFFRSGYLMQYLEVIKGNLERCKKITSNLLHFSRPSKSQSEWFSVNEVVENSLSMIAPRARKMGITIKRELSSSGLPLINGDAVQLVQVLLNVFNNALDAMRPKEEGVLSVKTEAANNLIVIKVVDTGIGMSEEQLKQAFDPFYTTKAPGQGTGLGLSICYEIIKQFRGTIQLKSEQGVGTEVIIGIPVVEGEEGNELFRSSS